MLKLAMREFALFGKRKRKPKIKVSMFLYVLVDGKNCVCHYDLAEDICIIYVGQQF